MKSALRYSFCGILVALAVCAGSGGSVAQTSEFKKIPVFVYCPEQARTLVVSALLNYGFFEIREVEGPGLYKVACSWRPVRCWVEGEVLHDGKVVTDFCQLFSRAFSIRGYGFGELQLGIVAHALAQRKFKPVSLKPTSLEDSTFGAHLFLVRGLAAIKDKPDEDPQDSAARLRDEFEEDFGDLDLQLQTSFKVLAERFARFFRLETDPDAAQYLVDFTSAVSDRWKEKNNATESTTYVLGKVIHRPSHKSKPVGDDAYSDAEVAHEFLYSLALDILAREVGIQTWEDEPKK